MARSKNITFVTGGQTQVALTRFETYQNFIAYMTFPAEQIALLINGKIEGDGKVQIRSFGKIEEATEGELSFLANPRYEDFLYSTRASVVIISESYQLKQPVDPTLIRVKDPYTAFALLLAKYQEMMQANLKGIEEPVHIAKTAGIGKDVYIGAFSYIGEDARIGDNVRIYPQVYIGDNVIVDANSTIYPGVRIYHHCRIGKNVIIHSGTVIGSDGFGFAPQADGSFQKVPQIGNVVIEDNVEIGANTSIDRATMGSTIIRAGAKLDNLIQVAHNVEIGNMTVIAAQAGISGSSKIGNGVMIGGQAGIAGHLQIADGSKINAQAGLGKSLKAKNSAVTGTPAYEYNKAIRSQAMARNIPEMEKRIQELERQIKELLQKDMPGHKE